MTKLTIRSMMTVHGGGMEGWGVGFWMDGFFDFERYCTCIYLMYIIIHCRPLSKIYKKETKGSPAFTPEIHIIFNPPVPPPYRPPISPS